MDWPEQLIRTHLERDIPQMGFRVLANRLRRLWMMARPQTNTARICLHHGTALTGTPKSTAKLSCRLRTPPATGGNSNTLKLLPWYFTLIP